MRRSLHKGFRLHESSPFNWPMKRLQTSLSVSSFNVTTFKRNVTWRNMYAVVIIMLWAQLLATNGEQACHDVEIPICKEALTENEQAGEVYIYKTRFDKEQQHSLAKSSLNDFKHLILLNCSHFTRLFVCLAHLPLCTRHVEYLSVLPCRSVCLDVYFNCIHLYNRISLPWPQHLNCSNFPKFPSLCVKPFSSPSSSISPTQTSASSSKASSTFLQPLPSTSFQPLPSLSPTQASSTTPTAQRSATS